MYAFVSMLCTYHCSPRGPNLLVSLTGTSNNEEQTRAHTAAKTGGNPTYLCGATVACRGWSLCVLGPPLEHLCLLALVWHYMNATSPLFSRTVPHLHGHSTGPDRGHCQERKEETIVGFSHQRNMNNLHHTTYFCVTMSKFTICVQITMYYVLLVMCFRSLLEIYLALLAPL